MASDRSARLAAETLEGILAARGAGPAAVPEALTSGGLSRAQRLTACAYLQLGARVEPRLADVAAALASALGEQGYARALEARLAAAPDLPLPATPLQLARAPAREVVELVTAAVRVAVAAGRERVALGQLEAIVYEHPEDREYLQLLRAIPGFDALAGKLVDLIARQEQLRLLSSNVRVTAEALPSLHATFAEACRVLDVRPVPPLFIEPGALNAYTVGSEEPIVVLTTGAVSLLDHAELLFVLGHELGHVKSQHVVYGMLARWIGALAGMAGQVSLGLGPLLSSVTIQPALYAWYRRSEYSADRAGLLCCQDLEVAQRTMAKMAGFPPRFYGELRARDFVEQARSFDARLEASLGDRLALLLQQIDATHPNTVARTAELTTWVEGGELDELVAATPAERRATADSIARDPQLDLLIRRCCAAVAGWAVRDLGMEARAAGRQARHLLRIHEPPPDGPLRNVFKVDVEVTRAGADEVRYRVHLLVLAGAGAPARVSLELTPTRWSATPQGYREMLLRKGEPTLTFEVFRRGQGSPRC